MNNALYTGMNNVPIDNPPVFVPPPDGVPKALKFYLVKKENKVEPKPTIDVKIVPMTEAFLTEAWDAEKSNWKNNWYPPNYFEHLKCLLLKYQLFPYGCWLAKHGDEIVGYAIAHPWEHFYTMPELNQYAETCCWRFFIPKNTDCYYIHDICVAPEYRRQGVGVFLTKKCLQIAEALGYRKVKLTSVLNSHTFWQKFGFECTQECVYGGKPAKVMVLNEF